METIYWFSPVMNILAISSIIFSLYLAGKFLPTLVAWINVRYPAVHLSGQPTKIILWLAMGALITSLLLDLVNFLASLINLILAPHTGAQFSFLLGTVSSRVYFLLPLILMAAVYGVVIYLGSGYISSSDQSQRTERTFIVLILASLASSVINSIITQVLSFQAPFLRVQQDYGLSGYLVEVLVGILLVFVILMGLNRLLSNHPASR